MGVVTINTKIRVMKYINTILCLLVLGLVSSCKQYDSGHRKYYDVRDNVIEVKQNIHNIPINNVDISNFGTPYILNQYLLISDYKSFEKLIYIFDKNSFKFITSVGDNGQGPGEIANMGAIIPNNRENAFYVIDHGHQAVYDFPMDSVLSHPDYLPKKKANMDKMEFPFMMQYYNDTLSYALFMKVINAGDYRPVVAQWNMLTGERRFMPYTGHPEIEKKRVSFAASPEHNLYVEVYWYHDLLSLCTLDGVLKYNLYGKRWNNIKSNENAYYDEVIFCKDKIVASYWGDKRLFKDNGNLNVHRPDKLIVFDLDGDYIATLEVGYPILHFCYDESNNRLIFAFDDDMQFAYLDLGQDNMKGIIR